MKLKKKWGNMKRGISLNMSLDFIYLFIFRIIQVVSMVRPFLMDACRIKSMEAQDFGTDVL